MRSSDQLTYMTNLSLPPLDHGKDGRRQHGSGGKKGNSRLCLSRLSRLGFLFSSCFLFFRYLLCCLQLPLSLFFFLSLLPFSQVSAGPDISDFIRVEKIGSFGECFGVG